MRDKPLMMMQQKVFFKTIILILIHFLILLQRLPMRNTLQQRSRPQNEFDHLSRIDPKVKPAKKSIFYLINTYFKRKKNVFLKRWLPKAIVCTNNK